MTPSLRFLAFVAALVFAASSVPGCGGDDGDSPYPDFENADDVRGEKNFAQILSRFPEARSRRIPWAGYWWPYLGDSMVGAMSKYATAVSSRSSVNWEIDNHGDGTPGVQDWWGHCNGWAAAAVLYREPRSPYQDGGIQFSIADQKALLSEIGMEVRGDFYGTRAETNSSSEPAFRDVFPNQFFLVLTNYIGQGLPLIMDRYTGDQVWNHPIAGYKLELPGPGDVIAQDPSAPNVYRIKMSATIWWARDDVPGDHLTEEFTFSEGPSFHSRRLVFEVWLDAPAEFDGSGRVRRSGDVILSRDGNRVLGGQWINSGLSSVDSHPDYLWIPYAPKKSTGFTNEYLSEDWLLSKFARP